MTDIEAAKKNLDGHTISLCKGEKVIVSNGRGVSPMIGFISAGADLNGYSVADKIVGKAAAMLFVKAGIKEVYAEVLSESGKEFLERNGVQTEYKILTERIINRAGTGVCPMEKTVENLSDVNEAYAAILAKLNE